MPIECIEKWQCEPVSSEHACSTALISILYFPHTLARTRARTQPNPKLVSKKEARIRMGEVGMLDVDYRVFTLFGICRRCIVVDLSVVRREGTLSLCRFHEVRSPPRCHPNTCTTANANPC